MAPRCTRWTRRCVGRVGGGAAVPAPPAAALCSPSSHPVTLLPLSSPTSIHPAPSNRWSWARCTAEGRCGTVARQPACPPCWAVTLARRQPACLPHAPFTCFRRWRRSRRRRAPTRCAPWPATTAPTTPLSCACQSWAASECTGGGWLAGCRLGAGAGSRFWSCPQLAGKRWPLAYLPPAPAPLPPPRRWAMFDDADVVQVGTWADVRAKCQAARIQPSLVFYEAAA